MLQPTLQYISLLLLLWSRNCCAPQKKKKTERGGCCGAQCIMGRTIKIAVVFTQHGVGLVRSASRGLTTASLLLCVLGSLLYIGLEKKNEY